MKYPSTILKWQCSIFKTNPKLSLILSLARSLPFQVFSDYIYIKHHPCPFAPVHITAFPTFVSFGKECIYLSEKTEERHSCLWIE